MIASNVSLETLQSAAESVGVSISAEATSGSGRRFRLKVSPGVPPDSALTPAGNRRRGAAGDGSYQRISASAFDDSRRVAAVCWHGFRDFFRAAFAIEPSAKFATALDTWDGSDDFEERFRYSGHRNVGSQFRPIAACEVCRCPDAGAAE